MDDWSRWGVQNPQGQQPTAPQQPSQPYAPQQPVGQPGAPQQPYPQQPYQGQPQQPYPGQPYPPQQQPYQQPYPGQPYPPQQQPYPQQPYPGQPQQAYGPQQPQGSDQVFGVASGTPATEGRIIEGQQYYPGGPVAVVPPHRRRGRWAVAIGLVACLVLVTGAAAFVAVSGSGTKSQTVAWAPKTSVAFATARLDLPGSQHDKVASILSHFPGGRDTSTFDEKYDQVLDKLVEGMAHDTTWSRDLKPWVAGEVSVFVTSFGSVADVATGAAPTTQSAFVVMVKDQAKAEAWVKQEAQKSGTTFKAETYDGVTLNVGTPAEYQTETGAYAFNGGALLLGTTDAVKSALDAKTKGPAIGENASYQAASKTLSGDYLGWYWMDAKAYTEDMLSTQTASSCIPQAALPADGAWILGSVHADDSSLTIEMSGSEKASAVTGSFDAKQANHASELAQHMPASTLAAVEVHSVGALVNAMIGVYGDSSLPEECRQQAAAIETAGQAFGGWDWIGDAAVVALAPDLNANPMNPYGLMNGGLVVLATSESAADRAMLAWPNALTGSGVETSTREVDHNGTKITVVSQSADFSGTGNAETVDRAAYARHGNLVVVGTNQAFVEAVLDATPTNSLGSVQRFKGVMQLAGPSNFVSYYVDLQTVADMMAKQMATMPADQRQSYECDTMPYVAPLETVAETVITGDSSLTRVVVTFQGKPAPLPSSCVK